MKSGNALFSILTPSIEAAIRDSNPWWNEGKWDPYNLPPMRRWIFSTAINRLRNGLTPAVVLRGPRQVGKTTLMNQMIHSLLESGVDPKSIIKVQFDELPGFRKTSEPILEIARWFRERILGENFNKAAHAGRIAYLFFDEVQNLADWAPQIKQLVDIHPVRVMLTGSSALRIEAGRDSLAGRISTLELGPLLLREIGELRQFGTVEPFLPLNGLQPLSKKEFWLDLRRHGEKNTAFRQQAFAAFSERGAYPIAQVRHALPWDEIAAHLVETVIRRAIAHDLRMGAKGQKRDENLLEEVFRLACRYIGQSPQLSLYLEEIRQALHANIGPQRIMAYLKFLDGALLIKLIQPLELRLKKRKGAAKICLCDPILRAAWLQERVPLSPSLLEQSPHLSDIAGRIAESVLGYNLASMAGLQISHFPERPTEPEIDFVITLGDQRIPIEVKYRRRIDFNDTIALRSFIEKAHYNAPFGLLITQNDLSASDDPRIVSLPLSSFLMMR
ncbi:MAG: ATP-binding protein [Myxococcales bacterium]|nr:ATP-binding protein [Myxococcales bacterium]